MHPPKLPLVTFHPFPSLPLELRLKIWQAACNISRTLTLTYSSDKDVFHCKTQPPTSFSVSHESRQQALRVYSLCFGTKTSPPKIYFNPYHDILYTPRCREMGYDHMLRDLPSLIIDTPNILDKVRYIAVDHVDPDIKRPWESYNKASFIRSFPNLEEVVLVLDTKANISSEEEVEMVEPKVNPERLLKIWYYFRQSFLGEERILEDVCRSNFQEYQVFCLPTVRIREKVGRRKGGLRSGDGARSLSSGFELVR